MAVTWWPSVCDCLIDQDAKTGAYISTRRTCTGHQALANTVAHYDTARAECVLTKKVVDAVIAADNNLKEGRISYSWDDTRKMTLTVSGSVLSKAALQAVVNAAGGVGKVTVA